MYRYFFFDLDGTLTDSKQGIFNSLDYAFTKMGVPTPPESVLRRFIGPPLPDSFREFCQFNDEQVRQGLRFFRERYDTLGKFENTPAPGMLELCKSLHQQGFTLSLASSKPERMCIDICAKFGFDQYLQVTGATDHEDCTKADVIRNAMKGLGLTADNASEILMIGDRKFDVIGANECNIDCVGVELFGYAQPGELLEAGAVAVFPSTQDLADWIAAQG